ncbi:hypothetical protein F5B22DRAFT_239028 [Xylaria bambusicola]|uniref:uncharacterized protein n=1 Tax=Xylaria bambusicola TaxID=326684 RepID=UPI002008A953|nr:uncharacterized protein F5B22DRAFT_239028 [Xylaria bambusicola]KAI0514397.1 hypothetical protein F5B22DRAFT_239028 [Xylaria bambusicola]
MVLCMNVCKLCRGHIHHLPTTVKYGTGSCMVCMYTSCTHQLGRTLDVTDRRGYTHDMHLGVVVGVSYWVLFSLQYCTVLSGAVRCGFLLTDLRPGHTSGSFVGLFFFFYTICRVIQQTRRKRPSR